MTNIYEHYFKYINNHDIENKINVTKNNDNFIIIDNNFFLNIKKKYRFTFFK